MSTRTSDPGGSAEPLVVGVDVATAEVRAEVRDGRGGLAASASAALPRPTHGADGSAEQDARTWWPAAREALARCTAELGDRSRAIAALAVCATSGTVTAVDTGAEPIAPAIMYDDRRGTEPAARARRAGAGRWNDIGITPSATSGLAHLALLAERTEDPDTRLVHTPDVIAERLVGHPVATDSSHALKSGYDPLREQWVHEALEAAGVAPERLPEVVAPARPLGLVSRKAAAETGLPVGCQVRSGMTDGCAGQLAAGAVESGQVVTVIGTTMVLKAVSTELVHDPTGVVYSHRHPEGGWLPGGASNTGGEALADVAGELAELDRAAEELGPAGLVCYPLRRRGERFPFSDERARGFRSAEPGDRVELHRARLEGVAFCEKLALRRLGALGVTVSGPIRTAGGGARSSTWCRIRASVLGEPVLRVPGAGTPLGAALLAASGTVHPDLSSAAAAMAPRARMVEPVAGEVERLAESYEAFRAELTARGWLA
ncbi:carbohydrate kinase [Actinopolyspora erythraea]|uniref:Carbohydrate kinase n=1 Tax=Actinopolyspora erythraea TaxID=414996 RepID=A0A099DAG4_9ACTN|nr:FGGY-family carbohydrate kinase [Actinopolyspora erythraea]ASU77060.1 carbohydrate kinase [Actinopolyspora erythraea]KGI83044.1 carbohydrate kinase [Actinopolyspora erythraea]